LPSTWGYGLEDLPGYNKEKHTIKLTTQIEITKDENENSVGFLGRSHPLVRCAINRVKNVGFTKRALNYLDPRVSAVKANEESPKLLFTFLGSISTKKEKIFEKVIALKVDKTGNTQKILSPIGWSMFFDKEKAIDPSNIWKKHFFEWGEDWKEKSLKIASSIFTTLAEEVKLKKKEALTRERENIDEWFYKRVEDITGKLTKVVQLEIFGDTIDIDEVDWTNITEPIERLTKFCQDKNVMRARRSEGGTLLKIYIERIKDIEMLSSFETINVRPLGILMIIPEGEYK